MFAERFDALLNIAEVSNSLLGRAVNMNGSHIGRLRTGARPLPKKHEYLAPMCLYTEQKKLAAAVSRAASDINQICRRINSTGRCYEDDVAELKARQAEIWELLKMRQRDEL